MKIHAVGGYNEVGKNMTAIQLGEDEKADVLLCDAGLYLPPIVELEEKDNNQSIYNEQSLRRLGAIPDDTYLDRTHLRSKVRALLISHAHLDHVGAVPYMAYRYHGDVVGTQFTTEVLKTLMRDQNTKMNNRIVSLHPNSSYKVKGKKEYKVEFINMTHSTIQTALIAIHTDEGVVLYANDFKLDNTPILGQKPNYERIKQLAKQGVKALVVESLYAADERKTPSEKIARDLLQDVLLTSDNKNACLIVTTFSSHIARLKSIVDFGRKLNRQIIFLGRSLHKYVQAAIKIKMCPFQNDVRMFTYKNQLSSILKKINKNRSEYMIVCTGHQGEPGSMLERMSRGETAFQFSPKDHVIFSSKTIPSEVNIANKAMIEKRLKSKHVRIFDSVHVSGHASREDLRDFINMINPEHIIPAHGDITKTSSLADLASEMGYRLGKNCHILQNAHYVQV